jgi:uncharacterized membrane protein
VVFVSVPAVTADVEEVEVESTVLTVYRDGLVHVAHTVAVNETVPSFTLRLLSASVDNLIAVDENQTVLYSETAGQDITIYSLGAKNVFLDYDTASLTNKSAEVWILDFESPYNLTVFMPEGSAILDLSDVPTFIVIQDDKIQLTLNSGFWEISYVVPTVEPAEFVISNPEVSPAEVKVGENVTISAVVTNIGGSSGTYTVTFKINDTVVKTETVTLQPENSSTVQYTVSEQTPGTYHVDLNSKTAEFTVKASPPSFPYLEVIAVSAIGVVALSFLLLKGRGGFSVEKILKTNPYLKDEDKEVILFIAEKGGKVFEAEIRERFPDMPRTSLWRLVKRLEKLDIVKIKRIGLENQVELKK